MRNLFPFRSETMYRRGQVGRALLIFVIFSRTKSLCGLIEWGFCWSTLGIGGNRWGRINGTTDRSRRAVRNEKRAKPTFWQCDKVFSSSKWMSGIGFGDQRWTHGATRILISSSLTNDIRGKDWAIQRTSESNHHSTPEMIIDSLLRTNWRWPCRLRYMTE